MAIIYIRISDNRIYARNIDTGIIFDEPSVVAFTQNGKHRKIMAVGQAAKDCVEQDGIKKASPFDSHPRVIIDDIELAEALVKFCITKVKSGWSFFMPILMIHVSRKLEGSLSAVEKGALVNIGEYAGARKVFLMTDEAFAGRSFEEGITALQKAIKSGLLPSR